jgi:hypothetical protein
MTNGNITKIIIGGGMALLTFMGYGIVDNEIRNVNDHKEIRKEVVVAVNEVKDIVTDVRLEQREQRVLLKGIASKL